MSWRHTFTYQKILFHTPLLVVFKILHPNLNGLCRTELEHFIIKLKSKLSKFLLLLGFFDEYAITTLIC